MRRHRAKSRKLFHEADKASFTCNVPLTAHFDGKQVKNAKFKFVEVLPIVLTGVNVDKLIDVVELDKGTGKNIADEVFHSVCNWEVEDNIAACCYDTTSVNTGVNNGAFANLEDLLGRPLLACACRHHFRELELKAVCIYCLGKTEGPAVPLFKYFQKAWSSIDKTKFKSGFASSIVPPGVASEMLQFAKTQLLQFQPRGDYRELLDLTVTVLGGNPNPKFKVPGALHHARWMSKAIYGLKIYMFRDEIDLTDDELYGILMLSQYLILVYIKAWFTCQSTCQAPANELELLVQYQEYEKVNPGISAAVLDKQLNHLWYLGQKMVCLSLFDRNLSNAVKRDIADAVLHSEKPESKDNRGIVTLVDGSLPTTLPQLSSFVTKGSSKFFEILGISSSFLDKNPSSWPEDTDYQASQMVAKHVRITNDVAEGAVALATGLNGLITRDKYQKKCLILGVHENRKARPNSTKRELCKS